MPSFCAQCGAPLRTGARFCEECGASVGKVGAKSVPGSVQRSRKRNWLWLVGGGGIVFLIAGILVLILQG